MNGKGNIEDFKIFYDSIVDESPRDFINTEKFKFTQAVFGKMRRSGLTQAEVAKRMKCSQQYISKLVSGRENMTIDTMVKMAMAVGLKLNIQLNEPVAEAKQTAIVLPFVDTIRPPANLRKEYKFLDEPAQKEPPNIPTKAHHVDFASAA